MLSVTDVRQFYLGVQGENEEQTITVDVKPWLASYPNGVVSIWHKRNGESVPTPTGAVYDAEAGTITWIPTYTDTYNAGEGEAEIRLYENGVIKKTRIVKTGVAPSVTGAAGVTLESGWQGMINYIDDVVEDAVEAADDAGDAAQAAEDAQGAAEAAQSAAEDAQTAAESAQGAAETAQEKAEDAQTAAEAAQAAAESAMLHYPYVDPTTGNWMLWDPSTEAYINTGIHAQGPTGTVPDIQVGTVTTLLPDQPATVTRRSGSPDEEPIFDFGIPKGDTGQAGNIYGNTIDMSVQDSTKVSAAIGAKTDKVREATSGNFAGLDANGNLTDSGSKASDFLTSHQDISGKADKVSSATNGNFAGLDSNGNLTDSGHKHSDYLTSHQDISGKQDKTDNSLDTTAKTVVGAINEHESDITSLNSKININAYDVGSGTKSAIESALVTLGGTLSNYEFKNIRFAITTASTPFSATTYMGTIMRYASGRYLVNVTGVGSVGQDVEGCYKSSAWSWASLNSRMFDNNIGTPPNNTINNPNLFGSYFGKDNVVSGLPTSSGTYYYSMLLAGNDQIAIRYSSDGPTAYFVRYYINDAWYGWTQLLASYTLFTVNKSSSANFTLPGDGVYLLAGFGSTVALNSAVFLIGGYTSASRCTVTNLSGVSQITITNTNTSALTFTASNASTSNSVTFRLIQLA